MMEFKVVNTHKIICSTQTYRTCLFDRIYLPLTSYEYEIPKHLLFSVLNKTTHCCYRDSFSRACSSSVSLSLSPHPHPQYIAYKN